jgi:hypothetical protein
MVGKLKSNSTLKRAAYIKNSISSLIKRLHGINRKESRKIRDYLPGVVELPSLIPW